MSDGNGASTALAVRGDGTTTDEQRELERLRALPKEFGVLMLVVGVLGVLLPGPVGAPFVVMGGVVLWPSMFERVEIAFGRRFPKAHRQGVRHLHRFIDDLERRYPSRP